MRNFLTILFSTFILSLFSAKQEISFSHISLQTTRYLEASCLMVKFDATLKYTYNNLLQQGDSSTDQYVVEIRYRNSNYIQTGSGYANYHDEANRAKNSIQLLLSNDVKVFDNMVVYIPLAAIDVNEGMQNIQPVFRVVDKKNRVVVDSIAGESFQILFPQKIHLKLWVKEVVAAETDFKNEFWDYFFTDTNSAKPEVCWSVLLVSKKINGSPHTDNNYHYLDETERDAIQFVISKNDIFYINVYDFDMMSFSDKIGSMKIDMNEMAPYTGTNFTSKFGKVSKMDFVITIL